MTEIRMHTYLAVDLAKVGKVGVALFTDNVLKLSGHITETKKGAVFVRNEQGKPIKASTPVPIYDLWATLVDVHDIRDIVVEDTFVGKSGAVAMKLAEARGYLMGMLRDITFHRVPPADWRSTICKAHGLVSWPKDRAAGKDLSVTLARSAIGYDVLDDNEADAIHLGRAFHMQGRTL